MVYGSPSEKEESEYYNDALILEAVPEVGVSIHTLEHYLEYPKEWNLAVLRLQEPPSAGGERMLDRWEHRCLLKRLALGSLQAHYDNKNVIRQTLMYTARTMDAKGRSVISGLVKGAIGGILIASGLLLLWGVERLS
jgi:hypothetical protein